MEPDPDLLRSAAGSEPLSLEPVAGGYTRSCAWRATTRDGTAFVKQADDEGSLHMLRQEAIVYRHVRGSFLPGFVGFADGGERAALAIEYIADAHWPPPYPDDVTALFDALADVAVAEPPGGLPRVQPPPRPHWGEIAADPALLLSLGLCTAKWLTASLDTLVEAESRAEWTGDALVHHDVYSGSVGFTEGRAVLVDWDVASIGSPSSDMAFALLSVRSEGGCLPDARLVDEGVWAAALTGHFAVETPKPLPEWADPSSTLREDMAQDLAAGLQWCVEALGLLPLQ